METGAIISIGFTIFILFLVILLRRKSKNKQIFFPIKKITTCKDFVCHDIYKIQGIPYREFRTFEEARRYALFLKNAK